MTCRIEDNIDRGSGPAAARTSEPVVADPIPARISIERLSSEAVSVCWSDARLGRCSEQIWRLGRARIDSYCLLTGRRIRYGDKVFRPRTQRGYPSPEYNRMILACVLNDFFCNDVSARQALGAA
ncbi:MAG TPA: DUF3331 domain-containing protein [Paraburkholderia sp.]